ncbi:MAG TPA: serine/threonine-protein kinase [Myxococcaceae bacterium]|nr:serine/threonine-protein kinase [Myxococcaceae bacterium]
MGQEARAEWRPAVGERVDSYHLEEKLGEGGFGSVYRARRGGQPYAVKFLSLVGTDDWGWRELEVLLRLRQVGGVTLEGVGKWPAETPRYLYIAMEYVRGRTLDAWARQENPTARRVAALLVPLARYLEEVHAKGVTLRDVKAENILVREDGRPVLVDFGVGTYEGALEVTGWRVPGTRTHQSPEAIRFMRQRREEEERYPPTPGDDVWALGVVLYKLLTNALPFQGPNEGELAESILTHRPVPPHERNPRVPRALGELCLRLLEKEPGARLREAKALGEALEAVLAGADAAWDVPLCEAYAPDNVTTARSSSFPLELEAEVARMERLRGYAPRRGPRPPARESSSESSPRRGPASPWRRVSRGSVVLAVSLGAVALLAAGGWLLVPREPEARAPGQEVAHPGGPPEGDEGAAPPRAATPAPVASATLEKDGTSVKTSQQQPLFPTKKQLCTMLEALGQACVVCTAVAQVACVSPQVRPTPPPEECPSGSLEAMRELGISIGDRAGSTIPIEHPGWVAVRDEAPVELVMGQYLGRLPPGTVLTGRALLGGEHVQGRFTQARTPGGEILPVCVIAWNEGHLGFVVQGEVGQESARIHSTVFVKAVQRFE